MEPTRLLLDESVFLSGGHSLTVQLQCVLEAHILDVEINSLGESHLLPAGGLPHFLLCGGGSQLGASAM